MTLRRTLVALLAAGALLVIVAGPASAAVIDNGGFESGDFDGWVHRHSEYGSWDVVDAPQSGCASSLTGVPYLGDYSAVANQGDPSRMALIQRFKVPAQGRPELSMVLSYDSSAAFETPATLALVNDNQQLRVDLLRKEAKAWSVKPADVLEMVFRTEVGDSNDDLVEIQENLRPFRGRVVKLRVAVVAYEECFGVELDGVRVS